MHRKITKGRIKMNTIKKTSELEDVKINVKLKLSALWVALMFFYIYADLLGFYTPGHIESLIAGEVAGKPITLAFYLGTAIVMAIPSVMVFLSLTLKAKASRWANIIAGVVYLGVLAGTFFVGDLNAYYYFYAIVEGVLIALIVWHAWKWPKQEA
jgi:hypothetical protein